jgi:hypothetical protein
MAALPCFRLDEAYACPDEYVVRWIGIFAQLAKRSPNPPDAVLAGRYGPLTAPA